MAAPDAVIVAGTDGKDVITVTQVGSAVSIAGLPAQVTIAHSEATDTSSSRSRRR